MESYYVYGTRIETESAEFIVACAHIELCIHTTLRVFAEQGVASVMAQCLDLVILKSQVKGTYNSVSQGLQPKYVFPSDWAENIEAPLSHYSHPWQQRYPFIVFHLSNTCSLSSILIAALPSTWFYYFFWPADSSRNHYFQAIRRYKCTRTAYYSQVWRH